jgi:hypothetical protein
MSKMIDLSRLCAAAIILVISFSAPLHAKTSAAPKHHTKRVAKKSPSKKHKTHKRTISGLIEEVLARKSSNTLTAPTTTNLGYPDSLNTYGLEIAKEAAPDHCEHAIDVVYGKKKGTLYASDLIFSRTCITDKDGKRTVTGHFFRCTTSGVLIAAVRERLENGNISATKGDIGDLKTKLEFDDEMNNLLSRFSDIPLTE